MTKGVVPIPGAKKPPPGRGERRRLGWSIDEEDVDRLDVPPCPGYTACRAGIWQHG